MNQTKVLIVDDEPEYLSTLALFIGRKGFDVLTAGEGEEALALAASERSDVVILDILMPGMKGPEVSQKLREVLPEVKIIFASAYTKDDRRIQGLLGSGDAYITKPFELNELLANIQEIL